MAIKNDNDLATEAYAIRDADVPKENTATRVGTLFFDLIDSKVNIDRIDDDDDLTAASTFNAPSQSAVIAYVAANSGAITVKVPVSSAEILALSTTPKTLIAAPGAGKIIVPLAITIRLNFNSVAYTTNLNLRGRMGGNLFQNGGVLGLSALAYSLQPLTGGIISSDISNTALTLDVQTGDPVAGNSSIDVYITYTIVTL